MPIRTPPPKASIATVLDDTGKLHAPSAARNVADLCEAIASIAPPSGEALEIASGTGQHVVAFAAMLPAITWHPSEVDPQRLRSIDAYLRDSALSNIAAPIPLNATKPGWGASIASKDLILLVNLLHLISKPETETFMHEAAQALNPSGQLFLYGPFKRDGVLTSDGDASFDASIRASDADLGYKDDAWIKTVARAAGLALVRAQDMPANNLAFIFRKS